MGIVIDPSAPAPTPPVESVSPDGILTVRRDDTWAGVYLIADYSAAVPVPQRVRFVRSAAGGAEIPLRGGDLAWAPGGVAVGYDHEAELGASSAWYAYPVAADGTVGARSQGAGLAMPEPDRPRDVWLKAVTFPGLSLRVIVTSWPSLEYAERQQRFDVLDASAPVLSVDEWSLASGQMTLLTESLEERAALLDLLTSKSVLLSQTLQAYGRPDAYWVPGRFTEEMVGAADDPGRRWTVDMTQVDRPPTVDTPLRIPDRSYTDSAALWPTYADRTATGQTYQDVTVGG
ncbi:hypothetical protein [Streptomyces sp. bgisy154]|uniref:hypothetical protein n=1 Tax=Streptomyces sp. bgisy154 TaxID=3413794 RepID=UPI003D728AB0